MKAIFITLLFSIFSTSIVYAQEQKSATSLAQEDYKKIAMHLYNNYNFPTEFLSDTIKNISYQIQFQIDENGSIQKPQIIDKTAECKACEQELLRVMKSVPKIKSPIRNNPEIKEFYTMPFKIIVQ